MAEGRAFDDLNSKAQFKGRGIANHVRPLANPFTPFSSFGTNPVNWGLEAPTPPAKGSGVNVASTPVAVGTKPLDRESIVELVKRTLRGKAAVQQNLQAKTSTQGVPTTTLTRTQTLTNPQTGLVVGTRTTSIGPTGKSVTQTFEGVTRTRTIGIRTGGAVPPASPVPITVAGGIPS